MDLISGFTEKASVPPWKEHFHSLTLVGNLISTIVADNVGAGVPASTPLCTYGSVCTLFTTENSCYDNAKVLTQQVYGVDWALGSCDIYSIGYCLNH